MSEVAQQDLTGVWDGMFSYPRGPAATTFTAVLMELGGTISGTTHEMSSVAGQALDATLEGARENGVIRFTKLYAPDAPGHKSPVVYEGVLSSDATEIEGDWSIEDSWSGKFIMVRSGGPAEAAEERQALSVPAL